MSALIRRMHPRRALDILAGSILNRTKKKAEADLLNLTKAIAKGQAELNEQIRSSSPNFYLVDPKLLATTYIDFVLNSSDISCTKPVHLRTTGLEELENLFIRILNLESNFRTIGIDEIITELDQYYKVSIAEIEKIAGRTRHPIVEFQRAAAKAGEKMRKYLNLLGVRRVIDANKFIDNLNNRIAIIAPTFNIAVKNVNEKLQSVISGSSVFLKKYGISHSSPVYIGNLVHSGHVGIYGDSGFLGINMPSSLIASAVTNRGDEIEKALGNLQIHIENGIKINPNYTQHSGMLLDLQLNFTVSMTNELNSKILGPQEQAAIRSVVGSINNESLQAALKNQVSLESLRQVFMEVSASPNFQEYLVESLLSTLRGTNTPTVKHTKVEKGLATSVVTQAVTTIKKSKSKVHAPAAHTKKLRDTKGQFTSLASLQTLLNQAFARQIAKNMGQAGALKYQTGRFANSVQVERLSQSREGMITAFYSYMKSPYQTFEPGFKQGSKQKDPRLLISKSVREIAAGLVGNRLRAVSI